MMRGDNRRAHCVYILFGVGTAVLGEATTSAWGQCGINKLLASDGLTEDRIGRSDTSREQRKSGQGQDFRLLHASRLLYYFYSALCGVVCYLSNDSSLSSRRYAR